MKILNIIIIIILAVLSLLAGGAKLFQVPQEMEFLRGVGLSITMITLFGVVQVAGGALLLLPITRLLGAVIATIALLVSAVLVFMSGNHVFGMVSLVPVVLGGYVIQQAKS